MWPCLVFFLIDQKKWLLVVPPLCHRKQIKRYLYNIFCFLRLSLRLQVENERLLFLSRILNYRQLCIKFLSIWINCRYIINFWRRFLVIKRYMCKIRRRKNKWNARQTTVWKQSKIDLFVLNVLNCYWNRKLNQLKHLFRFAFVYLRINILLISCCFL